MSDCTKRIRVLKMSRSINNFKRLIIPFFFKVFRCFLFMFKNTSIKAYAIKIGWQNFNNLLLIHMQTKLEKIMRFFVFTKILKKNNSRS
jgi:hypothetical protein